MSRRWLDQYDNLVSWIEEFAAAQNFDYANQTEEEFIALLLRAFGSKFNEGVSTIGRTLYHEKAAMARVVQVRFLRSGRPQIRYRDLKTGRFIARPK